MTKSEMAKSLASDTGLTIKQCKDLYDSFLGNIEKELKEDGECTLKGFGKFTVAKRAARMGRNPSTGESIEIPSSSTVRFKVSPVLKKEFN